jgi:hypothetical protein
MKNLNSSDIVGCNYIPASSGVSIGSEGYPFKDVHFRDSRSYERSLSHMATSLAEMDSNTLLDRSISTLSCVDSVLTYNLIAVDGEGRWNFGGTVHQTSVPSASVILTSGTDANPVVNYVYYELVGEVPTLKSATAMPSCTHICVAVFIVGAVSGTNYTIYGYNRARFEVDYHINRSIKRAIYSGPLYMNGFNPTVNASAISIAANSITPGRWMSGLFEFFSENTVASNSGFYFIKSDGSYNYSTNLADLNEYSNGTVLGSNERQNIVWGVAPCTTTSGGAVATTVKLFAVLQSEPRAVYTSDSTAKQDLYGATNYYPPDADLKLVFVPIAKTIVRPSIPAFVAYVDDIYHKDLRGGVLSGGAAASSSEGLVPYVGAVNSIVPGASGTINLGSASYPMGTVYADTINSGTLIGNFKSGTDQSSAGALAGELWVDTSDGYTVKMGV